LLTLEVEKLSFKVGNTPIHHPNNSHKVYYDLKSMGATVAKIARKGDSKWYNFINGT
jgi:hypothetical protein